MITQKDILNHSVVTPNACYGMRVIPLSVAERLREQLKEEIEEGEAFGQYLWTQHQTNSDEINKIINDLITDVVSQINHHKELVDCVFGVEAKK